MKGRQLKRKFSQALVSLNIRINESNKEKDFVCYYRARGCYIYVYIKEVGLGNIPKLFFTCKGLTRAIEIIENKSNEFLETYQELFN